MDHRATLSDRCDLNDLQEIALRINHECNLNCAMCGQKNFHRDKEPGYIKNQLTANDVRGLIAGRPELAGKWLYIMGGEPFLNPDLFEIICCVKKLRMLCCVNTNGTFLSHRVDEFLATGIDVVMVSIDGLEKDHDSFRGKQGAFAAAVEGIRAIQNRRRLRPVVFINCIVTESNVDHLCDVAEFFTGLHVNRVNFILPLFLTMKTGRMQQRIMKEHFGFDTQFWKWFVHEPPRFETGVLRAQIASVQQRFATCRFNPDPSSIDLEAFFVHPERSFREGREETCRVPWRVLEVLANGDVTTCRDLNDFVVGNIRRESLDAIWNGKLMREYRAYIAAKGLFPICNRCCQRDGYQTEESRAYVVR